MKGPGFRDGLVQNISYNFLGGLRYLNFSKKLINVFVNGSHGAVWVYFM